MKIAPGLKRTFAYQQWTCVDNNAYALALDEAQQIRANRPLNIIGADISSEAISIAKYHAKQAGVDNYIKFNIRKAQDFKSNASYGVNISNPPYGERLSDLDEVKQTAVDMGKLYKTLNNWNFYFLSPYQEFERCFGRRADKKRYIYNAGIKCSYFAFLSKSKPPKPV